MAFWLGIGGLTVDLAASWPVILLAPVVAALAGALVARLLASTPSPLQGAIIERAGLWAGGGAVAGLTGVVLGCLLALRVTWVPFSQSPYHPELTGVLLILTTALLAALALGALAAMVTKKKDSQTTR